MDRHLAGKLEDVACRFATRTALVAGDKSVTYADLNRRAAAFAASLRRQGISPGDRVALAVPGGVSYAVALLATLRLGTTTVPIDAHLKGGERQEILDDVQPRLVIERVDEADGALPVQETEAPPLILYTSGSTGRPKGAVISQSALDYAIECWAEPVMGLRPSDSVIQVLPPSHAYGICAALLAPLAVGCRVVIAERFTPEVALEIIRDGRITVFPGVATMFRRMLALPDLNREAVGSLRLTLAGAAPVPDDLYREWLSRTGLRILRGYGMTEVFRPLSFRHVDLYDEDSVVGRPAPGVDIRIVDEEGRPVAPGERGELIMRSPGMMDAYLNDPAETAAVLRDGWLWTGDLATLTASGSVRLVGRKRERIVRGGYSVFPSEVEAVLATHPDVAEAAVVGESDAEVGEEVVAYVVLREAATAGPQDLIDYCRDRLAGFKCPRRVNVLPSLPRSSTGKVLKARLTPQS